MLFVYKNPMPAIVLPRQPWMPDIGTFTMALPDTAKNSYTTDAVAIITVSPLVPIAEWPAVIWVRDGKYKVWSLPSCNLVGRKNHLFQLANIATLARPYAVAKPIGHSGVAAD